MRVLLFSTRNVLPDSLHSPFQDLSLAWLLSVEVPPGLISLTPSPSTVSTHDLILFCHLPVHMSANPKYFSVALSSLQIKIIWFSTWHLHMHDQKAFKLMWKAECLNSSHSQLNPSLVFSKLLSKPKIYDTHPIQHQILFIIPLKLKAHSLLKVCTKATQINHLHFSLGLLSEPPK